MCLREREQKSHLLWGRTSWAQATPSIFLIIVLKALRMDDMREKAKSRIISAHSISRSHIGLNKTDSHSRRQVNVNKNHLKRAARNPLLCAEEGFGAKFEPSKWPYTKLFPAQLCKRTPLQLWCYAKLFNDLDLLHYRCVKLYFQLLCYALNETAFLNFVI